MAVMTEAPLSARLTHGVVSMNVQLDATPAEVWPMLVDPSRTVEWSPVVPDRVLDSVGLATSQEVDGSPAVDATVTESREPWFLEHRWGPDTLTWQLAPSGAGTQLHLGHELRDVAQAPDMAAGWHLCLDVLRRRLAGEDVPRCVGQAALENGWSSLRADYAEQFTPRG